MGVSTKAAGNSNLITVYSTLQCFWEWIGVAMAYEENSDVKLGKSNKEKHKQAC